MTVGQRATKILYLLTVAAAMVYAADAATRRRSNLEAVSVWIVLHTAHKLRLVLARRR